MFESGAVKLTIYDFLEMVKNRSHSEYLAALEENEVWTAEAAMGYAEAAADAAGLDPETRSRFQGALEAAFENMTLRDAYMYHFYGD